MPTSAEELALIEKEAKYEAIKEVLEIDLEEESPSQAKYSNVAAKLPKLEEHYLNLKVAFKKYRRKIVPSAATEENFNLSESDYPYNDNWIKSITRDYVAANDAVVTYLDSKDPSAAQNSANEVKFSLATQAEVQKVFTKIRLESQQVTGSLDETYKRLGSLTHINTGQGQAYTNLKNELIAVLDEKIPALIQSMLSVATPTEQHDVERIEKEFAALEAREKPRLYQLSQLIAEKIVDSPQSGSSGRASGPKTETVHLKKMDPPSFSGREVDFPEFHRRWLAVVVPAKLCEEAEIDRLRDAVPKDAKEMLTGVVKLSKAWEILKKRFGDEDLIATKLKNELKGLVISEKTDHERIITLVVKIRSLVSRLESLKASEALKYDGEFISAVYFQLPDRHKTKWLEFDVNSYSDKWAGLLAFLETSYDHAVKEKLLLASYTPINVDGKKANAGALAAKLEESEDPSDIDIFPVTLHYVQDIIVNRGEKGRTVWDDGSNRVLINNDFAKENNLKSRDAFVTMNVVNDKKQSKTKIYELDLQDMYGKQHSIWGYGIDHIIDPDDPVDLSGIRKLFPHVPSDAFAPLQQKRIDILMGINFNGLHPSGGLGVDVVDNLKALRSRFGCGWVIGGCHKDLKTSPLKFSPQAAAARIARVTVIPDVEVHDLDSVAALPTFAKITIDPVLTPDFWESESMGVLPPRKCSKCKQCALKGDCSEAHYLLTLKEEAE